MAGRTRGEATSKPGSTSCSGGQKVSSYPPSVASSSDPRAGPISSGVQNERAPTEGSRHKQMPGEYCSKLWRRGSNMEATFHVAGTNNSNSTPSVAKRRAASRQFSNAGGNGSCYSNSSEGRLGRIGCGTSSARWNWVAKEVDDMPTGRRFHAAVALKQHIFVFGGELRPEDAGKLDKKKVLLNDLVMFDSVDLNWLILHVPETAQVVGPQPRKGHSLAVWDGWLVLFGGAGLESYLNDVWMFDTTTLAEDLLDPSGLGAAPGLGEASSVARQTLQLLELRPGMTSLELEPLGAEESLELAALSGGGTEGKYMTKQADNSTAMQKLLREPFVPGCYGQWQLLHAGAGVGKSAPVGSAAEFFAPPSRAYHTAVVYKDKLYIYGGYGFSAAPGDVDVWCLSLVNPRTTMMEQPTSGRKRPVGMWDRLACSTSSPALTARLDRRYGHVSCVFFDCMFIFGGQNRNCLNDNDIYKFNFPTRRWSMLNVSSQSAPFSRGKNPPLTTSTTPGVATATTGPYGVVASPMPITQGSSASNLGSGGTIATSGGSVVAANHNVGNNSALSSRAEALVSRIPQLPCPRTYHAGVLLESQGKWLVHGGSSEDKTFNDLYEFCFSSQHWQPLPCLSTPLALEGHALVVANTGVSRALCCVGGSPGNALPLLGPALRVDLLLAPPAASFLLLPTEEMQLHPALAKTLLTFAKHTAALQRDNGVLRLAATLAQNELRSRRAMVQQLLARNEDLRLNFEEVAEKLRVTIREKQKRHPQQTTLRRSASGRSTLDYSIPTPSGAGAFEGNSTPQRGDLHLEGNLAADSMILTPRSGLQQPAGGGDPFGVEGNHSRNVFQPDISEMVQSRDVAGAAVARDSKVTKEASEMTDSLLKSVRNLVSLARLAERTTALGSSSNQQTAKEVSSYNDTGSNMKSTEAALLPLFPAARQIYRDLTILQQHLSSGDLPSGKRGSTIPESSAEPASGGGEHSRVRATTGPPACLVPDTKDVIGISDNDDAGLYTPRTGRRKRNYRNGASSTIPNLQMIAGPESTDGISARLASSRTAARSYTVADAHDYGKERHLVAVAGDLPALPVGRAQRVPMELVESSHKSAGRSKSGGPAAVPDAAAEQGDASNSGSSSSMMMQLSATGVVTGPLPNRCGIDLGLQAGRGKLKLYRSSTLHRLSKQMQHKNKQEIFPVTATVGQAASSKAVRPRVVVS